MTSRKMHIAHCVAAFFFALGITAAGSAAAQTERSEHPFKLGILTELSGAGAELGEECRRGAETAFRALTEKGRAGPYEVQLVFGDTHDDARTAVTEFNRLVQNEAVQAVVMSRSKTAMPVNPVSRQTRIPVIATAGHPALIDSNPYAFRAYLNARDEGRFLAENVFALGVKRLAAVTIQDEWNLSFTAAFIDVFEKRGGTIVAEETLFGEETQFSTIISRIKRADPEAVFCNLQLPQSGPFIKKMREQGIAARLFSNYWLQKWSVQRSAGRESVEGLIFNEVDSSRPKFRAEAKALFAAEEPTPGTYICYVGTAAVIQALNNLGQTRGKETFADALLSLEHIRILDDTIPVRGREVMYPQKLRMIKDGAVVDAKL